MGALLLAFDKRFGPAYNCCVDKTHRYAKQKKINDWQDIMDEFRASLGILIRVTIHRLENCADYWSTHSDLGLPRVNTVMPRPSFFQPSQATHPSDNEKATVKADSGIRSFAQAATTFDCVAVKCMQDLFASSLSLNRSKHGAF